MPSLNLYYSKISGPKYIVLLFLILLFGLYFIFVYALHNNFHLHFKSTKFIKRFYIEYTKDPNANFTLAPVPSNAPIIVEWNPFTRFSTFGNSSHRQQFCPKKCVYTNDTNFLPVADMMTINFGHYLLKDFPEERYSNRMNVFISFESPEHRPFYNATPIDYFNVTATYRQDSDIVLLYDFFEDISDPSEGFTEDEVNSAIAKKKKPAMFMVSHCNTTSKREVLVDEIKKHIAVDQFGRCNRETCDKEECEQKSIESHYFTLGFENSDCIDYVTEKVYRLRKLIVPIILDRSILRGIHAKLNPYVIAVNDFKSIKELTDYMKFLIANPNEYKKYFGWTKLYKKAQTREFLEDLACSLCEIAWHKKNGIGKIIPNFHEWWGNGKCRRGIGEAYVKNKTLPPFID